MSRNARPTHSSRAHPGLAALALALVTASELRGATPKAGDKAPDVSGLDQDGQKWKLSEHVGKHLVLLYFYPKDDTPGCTAEAYSLRDNFDSLTRAGYTILGVSTDDQLSHKNFETKYNLQFRLIADVDTSINKQYGVWVEKERDGQKFWGTARTTFIIDEKGIVVNKIDKVDTKEHARQLLSYTPGQ